jgi:hypothetical protein
MSEWNNFAPAGSKLAAGPAADSEGAAVPVDAEVVEMALLLPRGQAAALERAALRRHVTVGQLLRHLIGVYVDGPGR